MRKTFALIAGLAASAAAATDLSEVDAVTQWQEDPRIVLDAADLDVADFQWLARPVVVFADTPNDPRFTQQMKFIEDRFEELVDRDVVVIVDTDRDAMSGIRTKLRPRGFMLVLIGKDGGVKLRKPLPWNVREISRSIDKMPMRQQEELERRGIGQTSR